MGAEAHPTDSSSDSGGVSSCQWLPQRGDELLHLPAEAFVEESISSGDFTVVSPAQLEPWRSVWLVRCPGQKDEYRVSTIDPPGDLGTAARRAVDRLKLPTPRPAPYLAEVMQLTQLPVWLWIDQGIWRTHAATATAGPVTATATATPVRVVWEMGTGDEIVCQGPGTVYDPHRHDPASASPDCGYTYTTTSGDEPGDTFTVTATIHWAVSWAAVGTAGGGRLPAMTTSQSIEVPVGEVQTVITGWEYDYPEEN